ncbi:MAG: glycosyltransferase family 2 protein [bacterium]|nr:glycosyltransferase family 2 protein [bacterium]
MKISIIIPVFNEAENIPFLAEEIKALELKLKDDFEVIWVDDASRDHSLKALRAVAARDNNQKVISFRKNCGQTAAISAGIESARGEILVPIDADLQNDPNDIPRLLAKLDEGFDVASGWRKERWRNKILTRRLPSFFANKLISIVTGVKLHDYGCTLKAYRSEFLNQTSLYGEMHRFIPAYAAWQGGRVAEITVSDRERKFGRSNYGISRTSRVLLDLLFIKFFFKYQDRPIHFFGGLGIFSIFLSLIFFSWSVYYKLAGIKDFVSTPLPIMGALFLIVGVNFILMGILAELFIRFYYESGNRNVYAIKEKINFN